MKKNTPFPEINDDPRKDGKTPMRTSIRELAREIYNQNNQNNQLSINFIKPFTNLNNSRKSYILPNAIKEGFREVFSLNKNIKFYEEVNIIIPVSTNNKKAFPIKRIDCVAINTENTRCIVIELKTSMGFDGYAASLMQFMLLHYNENTTLNKKKNKFNESLNNVPTHEMDILHVLCSINFPDHIEQWLPLLTRGTPLENKIKNLLIFQPFRCEKNGKMPAAEDMNNYINDFMEKIITWLNTGELPSQ